MAREQARDGTVHTGVQRMGVFCRPFVLQRTLYGGMEQRTLANLLAEAAGGKALSGRNGCCGRRYCMCASANAVCGCAGGWSDEPGAGGQERRAGCSVPRGAARGKPRLTDTHTTRRAIRFGVGIGARARKRAWSKPLLSTDGGWTDRHRPPWLQQSLNTGTTATCSSLSMLRFANADSPAKQS